MKILAIETSCDETAAAVTEGRRVISNVVFSQVSLHKEYGGVYPSLAKREHEKKIDLVIEKAMKNARIGDQDIDAIAVTFGQGLVIALEVGLKKAKELARRYQKPLIPVDHTEGHIYSAFAQNRNGNPRRDFSFPFLALVVSGGYTGLILVKDHVEYEVLGTTLDDAAGEALDKAAKMMGMSYPGGPIIEELAKKGDPNFLKLPIPLEGQATLNFSYSGLKTAFRQELEKMSPREIVANLPHLAVSFQKAAFRQIIKRVNSAFNRLNFSHLAVGGGVAVNKKLRRSLKALGRSKGIEVYFPYTSRLIGDNAAMIGVAGYFKYKKGIYLKKNLVRVERVARPDLKMWVKPA